MTSEDRISQLPADTRRHILSFLTTRDAILTSTLSRTWRYDWLRIPCLNFGRDFFFKRWKFKDNLTYKGTCQEGPDCKDALRFLEFLDRAVVSKGPTIQKLHLFIPPILSLSPRIASCLEGLIANELVVDVIGDSIISNLSRSCYVPKRVLSCNTMTELFIQGCNLSGISINEINLPSLRELSVNHVIMDQQMVENLVASCTGVEKLCFTDCEGFQSLQITRHPNLNYLEQKCNRGLELFQIDTANLRSLCHSPHSNTHPRCKLVLAASLHNLTHLELSDCRIDDGLDFCACWRLSDLRLLKCWFSDEWLDRHLSQLACLITLEIAFRHESEHWKITSAHLRSLKICCRRELEHVQINCPNLDEFIFYTQGNIISLSSDTTFAPACVSLQLQTIGTGDTTWDVKLVELFKQFRQSKSLSVEAAIIENVIIPRPVRQKYQSPLCEFEQLKLFPGAFVSCLDVTRSIEALLWLCPQLKTFHIMDQRLGPSPRPSFNTKHRTNLLNMLLKLNYKEPTELPRTSCGCYPSLPVNCWRHSLRDFEIIKQEGFKDDDGSLRRFLVRAITGI